MAPYHPEPENSRHFFVRLRELRDDLQQRSGVGLPDLSMGMSGDYEVAIEEGATIVRVGSAIFGTHARANNGRPRPRLPPSDAPAYVTG